MSGEMEAAGAMATAGLVAGAIEGREAGKPGEGGCLNCGTQLTGAFCAQCGQAAYAHRSLLRVFEELLHGVFHFDTKVWRTLPMLIFRPGTLTRNYVFGKRARYVSPLATFLLCFFMMFFVGSVAGNGGGNIPGINAEVSSTTTEEDVAEARAELEGARAALLEAQRNPPADEPEGLAEGLAIGAVERAEARVERYEARLAAQAEREAAARAEAAASAENTTPAEGAAATPPTEDAATSTETAGGDIDDDAEEGTWQEELREAVDRGDINVNLGHPYLNRNALESLRNPDLALYKVQDAASKFSFLLAPLSLPFIALLFLWKRGVTFYDHVVYALYALSFASLLFITLMISGSVFGGNMAVMMILSNVLLLVALPVHTFFQLGGAYALGWWSALWRTFFMLLFALLIASIFFLIVLVVGLAG